MSSRYEMQEQIKRLQAKVDDLKMKNELGRKDYRRDFEEMTGQIHHLGMEIGDLRRSIWNLDRKIEDMKDIVGPTEATLMSFGEVIRRMKAAGPRRRGALQGLPRFTRAGWGQRGLVVWYEDKGRLECISGCNPCSRPWAPTSEDVLTNDWYEVRP